MRLRWQWKDDLGMLDLEDSRWEELRGGYRTIYDPRPALLRLRSEKDARQAWEELWDGLHHQGDVGDASYAAVPHLVEIHRQRGTPDWNPYAMVATIELARGDIRNPKLPEWLAGDYLQAIRKLSTVGAMELAFARNPEEIRAILAVLAISKDARTHGRLLLNYSEEELLDFEKRALG